MQKYFVLFAPVFFSAAAQLLLKLAALKKWKSTAWLLAMSSSIAAYLLAFVLYSVAVRYFPVSLASPVNTISVMLLVIIGGILFYGEPFGLRQTLGMVFGALSMLLLLSGR